MFRRIALAHIFVALSVVIVLTIMVVSVKGQTTAPTVKGFSFAQVGQKYDVTSLPGAFKITKDLGNGWVEAESKWGTMFVNLNPISGLIPK